MENNDDMAIDGQEERNSSTTDLATSVRDHTSFASSPIVSVTPTMEVNQIPDSPIPFPTSVEQALKLSTLHPTMMAP